MPESKEIEPRLVQEFAFSVVGLEARTSNKIEMSGKGGKLGPLWRNFLGESDAQLPGDPDRSTIYCVYTEYQSDENGEYTVLLGRSVPEPDVSLPSGMRRVELDAAQYLVFRALDRNPESVQEAWSNVYRYFREHGEYARTYTADYDRYGPDGVHLYIAVRPLR